jgi:hypothetical protein
VLVVSGLSDDMQTLLARADPEADATELFAFCVG